MRFTASLLTLSFFLLLPNLIAEEADDLRAKGIAALKESQSNPRAIVDAARHFVKAAELYSTAGNEEKSVEMNSYLYWCKKKMTMQDIDAFVQGGESVVSNKLTAVEKLAPKPDEAQQWLDRAEQFANANPDEHLLIAIRFFEVAGRFKGSDASLKAQDRSLKELVQDKSAVAKPNQPPVAVSAPKPAPTSSGSQPIPPASKLKEAEKTIKDLFKAEYAKTDAPGRLALVAKLLQQADENKDDLASLYVLLHEARDLSVAAGDSAQALAAQKRLCTAFNFDFAAIQNDLKALDATAKTEAIATALAALYSAAAEDALEADNFDQAVRFQLHTDDLLPLIKDAATKARLKMEIESAKALKRDSVPALAALKTLPATPDDPEANLAAGKFALQRGRFETAFAHLAKGKDAALSSLAKRELTPPTDAAEQVKLADGWIERAEKEPYTYLKTRMQERAELWYGNALPALTGLAKAKAESRLSALDATVKKDKSLASVVVYEKMGYTLRTLKAGESSHNNGFFAWESVPSELQGKQFTQVVAGNSQSVTVKFLKPSRIYVLLNCQYGELYHPNLETLNPVGKKESFELSSARGKFEVWSVLGKVGQELKFPAQVGIVADAILLNATTNDPTAASPKENSKSANANPTGKSSPDMAPSGKSLIDPYMANPVVREWSERLNKLENWTIKKGNWNQEDYGIAGSDDSEVTLKSKLPQLFIMEFTMNIRKGMRPRMYFGSEVYFGNEGYSKGIAVQNPQHGTPFNYENGQELKVRAVFDKKEYEFFVDDTSVGKGARTKPDKMTFRISGGDSWSRGEVLYSKFKLLPTGNN